MDGMLKNNEILDDTLELLMLQMIKDNFKNKNINEEKFIITKQELYEFSIKLIKLVKEVYDDNR
jgi:hypothetical protein